MVVLVRSGSSEYGDVEAPILLETPVKPPSRVKEGSIGGTSLKIMAEVRSHGGENEKNVPTQVS